MLPYWETRDSLGNPWNYLKCERCALVRLDKDGSMENWLEQAYSGEYYGDGFSKFTGAIQMLREISAWRRAREIHRFFAQPGRALDIGCGEGLFLKSMKTLGWEVDGCEIGERAAQRAEQLLEQPVYRGEFENLAAKAGHKWQVVMLWHVLEHVEKPVELLRNIRDVVTEDGRLVVAVPNASSWQARLFGPDWFHLDPPRHLHSFGLGHLKQMVAKSGWKISAQHHFSLEYNPYGWAQSLLNAMGWKRDAMYENLRRHTRIVEGGYSLRMLAWLLLGPSILPAVLESLARQGGTIALYLERDVSCKNDN